MLNIDRNFHLFFKVKITNYLIFVYKTRLATVVHIIILLSTYFLGILYLLLLIIRVVQQLFLIIFHANEYYMLL